MKLSVLMPVYNEKNTLEDIIARVLAVGLPDGMEREVICVDDCSTDGSWDILQSLSARDRRIRPFRHEKNRGKGGAIRTAVKEATGDMAVIQDADLEYNPSDYPRLLDPILQNEADVVYGSRFAASDYRRVLFFWHSVGNRLLTTISNMLTDLNLTDMETGYKAFRMSVLKTIPIRSERFGFEPEITAKVAKRRLRVFEVPVRYAGRTYSEGKKIGLKDGLEALWVMIKFHVVDDLYFGRYGETTLRNMELATRFSRWLMGRINPFITGVVLEVGAGIGNNIRTMAGHDMLIATETDPEYLDILRNSFAGRRRIKVEEWDISKPLPSSLPKVDTILCSNVLEHVEDDRAALANIFNALEPGGRLILVVPAGPGRYGSIDKAIGHCRRYAKEPLLAALKSAGFEPRNTFSMNKIGVAGWWINGRLLRRKALPRFQLKLFNVMVPFFRLLDPILPWTGLSLVAVAAKPANTTSA